MTHLKKTVLLFIFSFLGLFIINPSHVSLQSNTYTSIENKVSSTVFTQLKSVRLEDKEGDRDFSRRHSRSPSSSTKDVIYSHDLSHLTFAAIYYLALSNGGTDSSYSGSKIEILSARPHPPTS